MAYQMNIFAIKPNKRNFKLRTHNEEEEKPFLKVVF